MDVLAVYTVLCRAWCSTVFTWIKSDCAIRQPTFTTSGFSGKYLYVTHLTLCLIIRATPLFFRWWIKEEISFSFLVKYSTSVYPNYYISCLSFCNTNIICLYFRMKRKYYSWDEAMNLREVKVRVCLKFILESERFVSISVGYYVTVPYLFVVCICFNSWVCCVCSSHWRN